MVMPFPWEGPVFKSASVPAILSGTYGIFCFKTKEHIAATDIFSNNDSLYVQGAVALFGRIVEHEYGYRAENALIKELRVPVSNEGYPLITTWIKRIETELDKKSRNIEHYTLVQIDRMKQVQWTVTNQIPAEDLEQYLASLYQIDVTIVPLPTKESFEVDIFKYHALRGMTEKIRQKHEIEYKNMSISEMSKLIDEDELASLLFPKKEHYYGYRETSKRV
jgi:hypothetical protein